VQAAALPTAYITGLQAIRDFGKLSGGAGGRVLVIGASGGCGTAGVQLAKALGAAEVIGICSGKNAELVVAIGADRVIDYTATKLDAIAVGILLPVAGEGDAGLAATAACEFDVIYDCATGSGGGENYRNAARALLNPQGGQYVAINGGVGTWLRKFSGLQQRNTHLFLTNMNTADLDILTSLVVAAGSGIRPVIAQTLPFTSEAVASGFLALKSRRTVGKIVFDISNTLNE
jgi:NADPH:quinone reductase-like Zn-dependent oxidoreductase